MNTGIFSSNVSHSSNALSKKQFTALDKNEFFANPSINIKRLAKVYKELKPLTSVHKDVEGRSIQLWKTDQYGLIGTIFDQQGQLNIISGKQIRNPLNDKQTPGELVGCLEGSPIHHWEITYDTHKLALTIWPHLRAAGREDTTPLVSKKLALLQSGQQQAVKTQNLPDGRVRYYEKEKPSTHPGRTRGSSLVTEHDVKRGVVRYWMESYDHSGKVIRVHPKAINGREINRPHYPPTGKELAQMAARKQGGPSGRRNPAMKDFQQKLQQTRLTDSYNATHRQNPVAPKGATGGDIGGVACSTAYIEGLFDNPETLFESEHFFCVPGLPDGKLPFSNVELRQILRELAIGVYTHSTIPFFSLHFNEKADQYPVIHPAYENTLVGRIISMLDYIMKGYLNGGVFTEKFIDDWHKDPDWKKKEKTALEQLIDFHEYCQSHGVEEYVSLRVLQKIMDTGPKNMIEKAAEKIGKALGVEEQEPEILQNFTGFSNSFRIIAKQNSIRKEGNLFLIDADFDVLYTIDPSPEYKAALEEYMRKHGELPQSYLNLENAYRAFCQRIHDNMVKIPFCRDYFAMLGVINFFSGYFSTLKKHRKVPVLPSMEESPTKGSPPLFPYLPVGTLEIEMLKQNPHQLIVEILKRHAIKAEAYFKQIQKGLLTSPASGALKERIELLSVIRLEIQNQLMLSASNTRAVEKKLKDSKEIQEMIGQTAEVFTEIFEKCATKVVDDLKTSFVDMIPHMVGKENNQIANLVNAAVSKDRDQLEKYFVRLYGSILNLMKADAKEDEDLLVKLTDRAQENIPQFRYGNRLQARELSQELLKFIRKNFTTMVSKTYSLFSEIIQKSLVNEWTDIASFSSFQPRIITELKPLEIEMGQKVVGGCGMKLQEQVVRTCRIANDILSAHGLKFKQMAFEEWTEITYGPQKTKGFVFRLAHENVPASLNDNYEWMESFLLIPPGVDVALIQERLNIEEAMKTGRKDEFIKLVNSSTKLSQMRDRSQRALIHHAACLQDPSYAELLIAKKLSVSAEDAYGYQPIHYAAMSGSVHVLGLLLRIGGPQLLNATSRNGSTPLAIAIQHRQLQAVKHLLHCRALFSTLSNGYNTLHCALHYGDFPIIEEVLASPQAPHFINQISKEGGTPLMLACELDSADLIEKMIAMGADPGQSRRDGVTAIEVGINRNCVSVVAVLLQHMNLTPHAIETAAKQGSPEMLELLTAQPHFYQYRNSYKDNTLHIAIRHGNLRGTRVIMQHCPDRSHLTSVNEENETPYSLAANLGAWELMTELNKKGTIDKAVKKTSLERLLRAEYNQELGQILNECELNSEELHELALKAAQAGNHQALSFEFKTRGVNLNALIGPKGWRILHYLAKSDGLLLFREIMNEGEGLSLPLREEGGKTLPYIAGENRSFRVLRLLLEQVKRTNTTLENHFNDRHLFYSVVETGDLECVQVFLKAFPDRKKELVNTVLDRSGLRPVHLAAKIGSLKLIRLFIDEGADLRIEDQNGDNPLCHAVRAGTVKVVSYLLENHADMLVTPRALFVAASSEEESLFAKMIGLNRSQRSLDHALFLAIQAHDTEAFSRLYRNGASFGYVSEKQWNSLILASATGQGDVLRVILKDRKAKELFSSGDEAIQEAANNGHAHCVLMLLDAGYEFKERKKEDSTSSFSEKNPWLKTLFVNKEQYRKEIFQITQLIGSIKGEEDIDQVVKIIQSWPLNANIQMEYDGKLIWGTALQLLLRTLGKTVKRDLIATILSRPELDPNVRDSDGNTLVHLLLKADISPVGLPKIDWAAANNHLQTPLHIAAMNAAPQTLRSVLEELRRLNLLALVNAKDDQQRTAIIYAIIFGKKENVGLLINSGADVNVYDIHLLTPLVLSYLGPQPSLSILKQLLEAGADPNQVATISRTRPLILALKSDRDELTRCLLAGGANCHAAVVDGQTLMHAAAGLGKAALLNLFAANRLSLEERDSNGILPIHVAANAGKMETIKAIASLQKEAMNAEIEIFEEPTETPALLGAVPLHMAARGNQLMSTEFFLQQQGAVEAETKRGETAFSFAAGTAAKAVMDLFSPYKISRDPKALCSALVQAIGNDNIDIVIDLYLRGVPIDAEIIHGFTGIQWASFHGAFQATQWLLQRGADPFYQCPTGENALQLAASNDSVLQFGALLEVIEPDLDEIINDRESLLHTAVKAGKMAHVVYLIKNFAAIHIKDSKGNLPIHTAVQNGRHEIASLLLACGADATAKTSDGKTLGELVPDNDEIMQKILNDSAVWLEESAKRKDTAIHLAVRSGNSLAILLMIQIGDVNEKNGEGETPLHVAGSLNDAESCRRLLYAGAEIDVEDAKLRTPLYWACTKGVDAVKVLVNAGADWKVPNKAGTTLVEEIRHSRLFWKEELLKIFEETLV
ncbi:MAG TPA: ankyrin repeat domain-containing protein [Chlamydiales bacterium]|nr:ankyrin repeat domain-containing protein [Chlamydiales bacterium]